MPRMKVVRTIPQPEAQAAIRETYEALIDNSLDLMVALDGNRRLQMRIGSLLGYDAKEIEANTTLGRAA